MVRNVIWARVVTQCAQCAMRCYGYGAGEEQRRTLACAFAARTESESPDGGMFAQLRLQRGSASCLVCHGGGVLRPALRYLLRIYVLP